MIAADDSHGKGCRLRPSSKAAPRGLSPAGSDHSALRNRGLGNSRSQRYDRAIQDFDEAIRLNSNVAAAFSGRAYALRFVGQYERAIADYRQALMLQPDDSSRKQIERILKQLGAPAERDAPPTAVTKR